MVRLTEEKSIQEGRTALFEGPVDSFESRVVMFIDKYEKYEPVYIEDLVKAGVGKYHRIRKVLDRLVEKGKLLKIKSFPVFYERLY